MSGLSAEEQAVVRTVADFVDRDVRPVARDLEHANEYPEKLIGQMKDLGMTAPKVSFMGPDGLYEDELLKAATCDAVIGVDSGPLHLAAALSKPGVAIFGPTDPVRNGPYGSSFRVLRNPDAVTTYKRGAGPAASMRAISPPVAAGELAVVLAGLSAAGCYA